MKNLKQAKKLIREKRGNDLMPKEAYYNPISAKSYNSLYGARSKMHLFDFHNPNFDYRILKSIEIPMLVIIGDRDIFKFDVTPQKKIEIFNQRIPRSSAAGSKL